MDETAYDIMLPPHDSQLHNLEVPSCDAGGHGRF